MRLLAVPLLLWCATAFADTPVAVSSRALSEIAIHPQREASAEVVSLNQAKLPAEIPARILRIPVEPGQRVSKGSVVAQLECTDAEIAERRAQAGLEAARARLQLAEQQLQRYRDLAARNFISSAALGARQTDLDVAKADVKVNAAARAEAQRDVGKCTIRSPFPAIVEARLAQVGELATPGTALVELWDTSRMQLSAQVQQSDANGLPKAQPVFVTQGREYKLRLLRVSPAVNQSSRTREARLRFEPPPPPPGSTGVLRWRDPRAFIPAAYVSRRDGVLGVFVLNGRTARFVPLPDAQEGRPAPAPALRSDARIIADGRFRLRDGETVAPR